MRNEETGSKKKKNQGGWEGKARGVKGGKKNFPPSGIKSRGSFLLGEQPQFFQVEMEEMSLGKRNSSGNTRRVSCKKGKKRGEHNVRLLFGSQEGKKQEPSGHQNGAVCL